MGLHGGNKRLSKFDVGHAKDRAIGDLRHTD
jgi:hypothetical protein